MISHVWFSIVIINPKSQGKARHDQIIDYITSQYGLILRSWHTMIFSHTGLGVIKSTIEPNVLDQAGWAYQRIHKEMMALHICALPLPIRLILLSKFV